MNKASMIRSAITTTLLLLAANIGASASEPGMTYESLAALPDFAGSWTPNTPPFVLAPPQARPSNATPQGPARLADTVCAGTPQLRAEAVAACRALVTSNTPGDRGYCAQAKFTGVPPRSAGGSLEILLNPGQVTISVESGLVRRIYLRDKLPPGALDESPSGASIGHWDGKTLVVDTTGLTPSANFIPGAVIGKGARVHERIYLSAPDTLMIESTITAPALFSAPVTMRQDYQRARNRIFTPFDTCVEGDRSFNKKTGQDQFDATPPADLPPPPAN
jgi:hypothetical protein